MTEYETIKRFVYLNEDREYVASSDEDARHYEFNDFDGHAKHS